MNADHYRPERIDHMRNLPRRVATLTAAALLAFLALGATAAPASAATFQPWQPAGCYTIPEQSWASVCLPSRLRPAPAPAPPSRWGCFRAVRVTGRWPHGCRVAWAHVAAARNR